MNFRNMILALSAMTASVGIAAGFEAGKGVANDLATGANQRDVTFIERGGNNSYGWQSYDIVLGVTVLPKAASTASGSTSAGARMSIPTALTRGFSPAARATSAASRRTSAATSSAERWAASRSVR